MIFKINKQTNLLFKFIAISQLIVLVIYAVAEIRNIHKIIFDDYLSALRQIQSTLILLYIINVFSFLGEKKFIRLCFLFYMILEFLFTVCAMIIYHIPHLPEVALAGEFLLVIFISLAAFCTFVVSFFIQSQLVFKPVILYTAALALYSTVEFALLAFLSLFMHIDTKVTGKLNWDSVVVCLMPIAVIWLSGRVNKHIQTQPVLND